MGSAEIHIYKLYITFLLKLVVVLSNNCRETLTDTMLQPVKCLRLTEGLKSAGGSEKGHFFFPPRISGVPKERAPTRDPFIKVPAVNGSGSPPGAMLFCCFGLKSLTCGFFPIKETELPQCMWSVWIYRRARRTRATAAPEHAGVDLSRAGDAIPKCSNPSC